MPDSFDNRPSLCQLSRPRPQPAEAETGGGAHTVLPRDAEATAIEEAVHLALDTNLQVLLARERIKQAQAVAVQARAPLLPNVGFTAGEANLSINLAAQGFTKAVFPGLPSSVIGPFYSFDSRLKLAQSLINVSALLRARRRRKRDDQRERHRADDETNARREFCHFAAPTIKIVTATTRSSASPKASAATRSPTPTDRTTPTNLPTGWQSSRGSASGAYAPRTDPRPTRYSRLAGLQAPSSC